MSERMNKERAKISNQKAIEVLDKLVREICEQSLVRPIELEYCNKALDIAIESINELSEIKSMIANNQVLKVVEKYQKEQK